MTDIQTKLNRIKLVILDVDGVLTDDTVFIGPEGMEFKRFCIADGLGIHIAKRYSINVAFLSGRPSPATEIRARELGVVDIFQKPVDKLDYYEQLKAKYDLDDENIAYVGNDLVDVGVMRKCGLSISVPDSPVTVHQAADYVTARKGGFGAVREILDMILEARGIKEEDRLA
ncbi:MAG: HAD hydrolase family protein [candidate division Zixibacteria bacterium]|nr:HAD hydrolase family protein [candidate division Zixibacteria bacterium]